ncbi:hypothetical protein J3458_020634 [Metarhizium acridum]|uniref:uncharacterized protein n=1 Tax=Metarhizium acridum TaxID=92637 RepID=UPI001C6C530D|nr:hypothetical protein J3458_020634 [Metarhizium acridum]
MQTGNNGKPLLDVVAASEKFKITLLVRKPPENYIDIVPDSVTVKQVDFQSHASLVAAFRGIDAVVSVVAFGPQSDIDVVEIGMINAAIEAGVKFFIPSEWAPDSAGANVTEDPWIEVTPTKCRSRSKKGSTQLSHGKSSAKPDCFRRCVYWSYHSNQ